MHDCRDRARNRICSLLINFTLTFHLQSVYLGASRPMRFEHRGIIYVYINVDIQLYNVRLGFGNGKRISNFVSKCSGFGDSLWKPQVSPLYTNYIRKERAEKNPRPLQTLEFARVLLNLFPIKSRVVLSLSCLLIWISFSAFLWYIDKFENIILIYEICKIT